MSDERNIRSERIRTLIRREGLTQKSLALKIGMYPESFCRALNSGKVSEKAVLKVVHFYPNYKKSWLLGYDDEMIVNKDRKLIDLNEALRGLDGMLPAKDDNEFRGGIAAGIALAKVRLLSLPVVEVEEKGEDEE